ncbi:MAG: hypothetical protein H6830_08140 [Planctomycetes bacterium]|nr:hypothetical protein [Planctomycetota bacterium]MCB9909753.1 hypothetical protein [Planctomycetota bacterium]MCB9912338.1 hypothetical protein [Planctomycetota bacterium]
MLLSLILLTASLAGPSATGSPVQNRQPVHLQASTWQAPTWHVPGTPPPAPKRDQDTPPVIKDKPLPPV